MPFVKGSPKPAGSGRKKGFSLKGNALETMQRFGCDPIHGMIKIAENKKAGKQIRLRAYAELAQYVYPKLRAIGMTGPGGGPMEVDVVDARQQLLSRIASLAPGKPKG